MTSFKIYNDALKAKEERAAAEAERKMVLRKQREAEARGDTRAARIYGRIAKAAANLRDVHDKRAAQLAKAAGNGGRF